MFRAKYTRTKFWVISILLLIPFVIINTLRISLASSEKFDEPLLLPMIMFIIIAIWINTLANRIRDYKGNPWLSLLSLIPIGNIIMAFYYGSIQYKKTTSSADSFSKEETDYSTDTLVTVTDTRSDNIDDEQYYTKAMDELDSDDKVKGTWAKAFAKSEGDEAKAKALYIDIRAGILLEKAIQEKKKDADENNKQKIINKVQQQDIISVNTGVSKKSSNEIFTLLDRFLEKNNFSLHKRPSETVAIVYSADNIDKYIEFINGSWEVTDSIEEDKAYREEEYKLKKEQMFIFTPNEIFTLLNIFLEKYNFRLNKRLSETVATVYSANNIDKYIEFIDGSWEVTDSIEGYKEKKIKPHSTKFQKLIDKII